MTATEIREAHERLLRSYAGALGLDAKLDALSPEAYEEALRAYLSDDNDALLDILLGGGSDA